ncbi:MAG: hypothetical protein J6P61_03490 [Erysipelotrichaceae bacterium]|nr:hypothetical protein [Erysipelotrichaceae bacterium]
MANWAYEYYYKQLCPDDQLIYRQFFEKWKKFETEIRFKASVYHKESFSRIADYLLCDHVDLFWIDAYYMKTERKGDEIIVTVPLFFTRDESKMYIKRLRAWRHNIVTGIDPSLSNKEKVYLLFDFIERRSTYGKEARKFSQTIVGACRLDNEVTVCVGFAKCIKYVCDLMNIPCIVVVKGYANFGPNSQGAHAWNIVEIEDGCRHIDGVRYLTSSKRNGRLIGQYLFTDAEVLAPRPHNQKPLYKWDQSISPKCI